MQRTLNTEGRGQAFRSNNNSDPKHVSIIETVFRFCLSKIMIIILGTAIDYETLNIRIIHHLQIYRYKHRFIIHTFIPE